MLTFYLACILQAVSVYNVTYTTEYTSVPSDERVQISWCLFKSIDSLQACGGAIYLNSLSMNFSCYSCYFYQCVANSSGAGLYVCSYVGSCTYSCFYQCSSGIRQLGYGTAVYLIANYSTLSYLAAAICPDTTSIADNGVFKAQLGLTASNINSTNCYVRYSCGLLLTGSSSQATQATFIASYNQVGNVFGFSGITTSDLIQYINAVGINSTRGTIFLWIGCKAVIRNAVFLKCASPNLVFSESGIQTISFISCIIDSAYSFGSSITADSAGLSINSSATLFSFSQLGFHECSGSVTAYIEPSKIFTLTDVPAMPLVFFSAQLTAIYSFLD